MKNSKRTFTTFICMILLLPLVSLSSLASGTPSGKVLDYFTGLPIKGALVTINNAVVVTDENGIFTMKEPVTKVAVRAHGYLRAEQTVTKPMITLPFVSSPVVIKLVPFKPKAVYLSFYGIGDRTLRSSALRLIEETELNSLVIDVKGDRGMVVYKSAVPLASEIGAQKLIIIKDIKSLLSSLKEKGIYTIARIVVFKDNMLALARPDLAIKGKNGEPWHDKENLAWVEPFHKEVWDYNISIAVEAAQQGFDEIQFDYVRFPDTNGIAYAQPNTEENRVNAISGFLAEARRRLVSYNVFLAADIFGYVFWNYNDTQIGQRLENVIPHLDYISPMLYPSGFQYGIPGYRNPVANSYNIVHLTLVKGRERARIPPNRFRPWLQAFRDYAFDRRHFSAQEIRDQIRAAEEFGSHGWMLWNPRNLYTPEGLKAKATTEHPY